MIFPKKVFNFQIIYQIIIILFRIHIINFLNEHVNKFNSKSEIA